MKIVLYVLIILLTFLAPVTKLDISKLSPVEAIAVYTENDKIILLTDEGSVGVGNDIETAVQNLKDNASAIVYLDTSRYLLIGDGAEGLAGPMRQYLRPSIKVGTYTGGDVKEEAKYLEIHADSAKPEG